MNISYSVIVLVRVVLKRNVVGDLRFDNLKGSHENLAIQRTTPSQPKL